MYLKDRSESQDYTTYQFQREKPDFFNDAMKWITIAIRKSDNMLEISNYNYAVTAHELLNCLRQIEELKGEKI